MLVLSINQSKKNKSKINRVKFEKGEFLVKLNSTNKNNLNRYFDVLDEIDARELKVLQFSDKFRLIKIRSELKLEKVLKKLNSNPAIEYAEPNYIYSIEKTEDTPEVFLPSESQFLSQWALYNNAQKIGKWGERIKGKKGADIKMPKFGE